MSTNEWVLYTSDTYPDGIITTGLKADTLSSELITTDIDPPIFTSKLRMSFLPHEDGKLNIGTDCSVCVIVDFEIEDPIESLIMPNPSLGSVSKIEESFELALERNYARAAI